MRNLAFISIVTVLALTACSESGTGGQYGSDTPETQQITPTDAQNDGVEALDFDMLALGAKIVRPLGPEVDSSFNTDLASISDLIGYVACTEGTETCDPKAAGDDMVYTYVYTVTPGVDPHNDDKFPKSEAVDPVAKATAFKMMLPAVGFTGEAGYSKGQAIEALGEDGAFDIRCTADGLTYEIASGTEWSTGETMTFFWKSTKPPKGPMDAFILEADGKTAIGAGPSPTTRNDHAKGTCP
ncbi:hypothetical protein [Sphingorhabdus sp. Alg239-R122]|uniref:hypothetical protein n=1 Tax=Sphingorhabdus sp. Alg239-R122 TaxID=2305989 RepID=UPI0013DCFE0F|nr:hypothetical protein [Sphingorhabdus sp. Alg239-R122]